MSSATTNTTNATKSTVREQLRNIVSHYSIDELNKVLKDIRNMNNNQLNKVYESLPDSMKRSIWKKRLTKPSYVSTFFIHPYNFNYGGIFNDKGIFNHKEYRNYEYEDYSMFINHIVLHITSVYLGTDEHVENINHVENDIMALTMFLTSNKSMLLEPTLLDKANSWGETAALVLKVTACTAYIAYAGLVLGQILGCWSKDNTESK